MLGLTCKRTFSCQKKTILHYRGDGLFEIPKKINDNAYKLNLHGKCNVFTTFNVADLSPFDASEDSGSNPFKEEWNDESHGGQASKYMFQMDRL